MVEKKARGEMIEEAGETEGARRVTGVFPAGAPPAGPTPDAEVVAKAERLRFTGSTSPSAIASRRLSGVRFQVSSPTLNAPSGRRGS